MRECRLVGLPVIWGAFRNTVKAALRSSRPPKYERRRMGSRVDAFEGQIRVLLKETPSMPTSVVMERVAWDGGRTVFYERVAKIRRDYQVADPVDKLVHLPGETMQWDLWFPGVPVGLGQGRRQRRPAVLVGVLPHSKVIRALMIPSVRAFDILAGMYVCLTALHGVPRRFLWDRQSGIATRAGNPTDAFAAFCGSLAVHPVIAPARDPETKGVVERANRYLETSFLPGRVFTSPKDFNLQLQRWLDQVANRRKVRGLEGMPIEVLEEVESPKMMQLPSFAPTVGFHEKRRLPRCYYLRFEDNDYSVDPIMIERMVDFHADLSHVWVTHQGREVARHERAWTKGGTTTDPIHVQRGSPTTLPVPSSAKAPQPDCGERTGGY